MKPHPTVKSDGDIMSNYLVPISALKPFVVEVKVLFDEVGKYPGKYNLMESIKIRRLGVFRRDSRSQDCFRGPKGVGFPKYILLWNEKQLRRLPKEVRRQAICTEHLKEGDRGFNADHLSKWA